MLLIFRFPFVAALVFWFCAWSLLLPASSSQVESDGDRFDAAPVSTLFFDLDAAKTGQQLAYEDLALVFALQGLVNIIGRPPVLMLNAAFLNFDWPAADNHWKDVLSEAGRVDFRNSTNATLCSLVDEVIFGSFAASDSVNGAVLYENALPSGNGYTLAMALTIASQERLLGMPACQRSRSKGIFA